MFLIDIFFAENGQSGRSYSFYFHAQAIKEMAQILDLIIGRGEFYNRFSADKRHRRIFGRIVRYFSFQFFPAVDYIICHKTIITFLNFFTNKKIQKNRYFYKEKFLSSSSTGSAAAPLKSLFPATGPLVAGAPSFSIIPSMLFSPLFCSKPVFFSAFAVILVKKAFSSSLEKKFMEMVPRPPVISI